MEVWGILTATEAEGELALGKIRYDYRGDARASSWLVAARVCREAREYSVLAAREAP